MNNIAIIILAAGASSRMGGRDKLLIKIEGIEQIVRLSSEAKKSSSLVIIMVPNRDHPRAKLLDDLNVEIVQVSNNHLGLGHSIALGVKEASKKDAIGVMIVPADMPELTNADFNLLIKNFLVNPNLILQATTSNNQKGHPVVFPRSLFSQLKKLTGDQGARKVITTNKHIYKKIRLPLQRATTDLDTEKEWADWLEKKLN